ncbi:MULTISPECIES: hypothetical protein [unclassified Francisella]|uniref:hypothetical protein n=1 Tax=unclassified Francisella TaxID=2610885 RepID=UPI002E2F1407|nr:MULTISPECIES: hypothetical protein [unclassified Francisella]MED7818917.1 hypothetical protein [Francisella sp. 19S2-4]MED7829754.1 hypothetical protein [Francisella sp. 19S2-10]
MIDSNKMLAIGFALSMTVRSKIKYSANMNKNKQLFNNLELENLCYKKLSENFSVERNLANGSYKSSAKSAFNTKIGNCGELSNAVIYLGGLINIKDIKENIYLNKLYFNSDHALVLLHQSSECYDIGFATLDKIVNLKNLEGLENAILIDPWIYSAVKVQNVDTLLEQARNYAVIDNYLGRVNICNEIKTTVSMKVYNANKFAKLIDKFNKYYQDELQQHCLTNIRAISLDDVKNNLELKNNKIKLKYLTGMRDFYIELLAHSSKYYIFFDYGNRKNNCIKAVVDYINQYIKSNNYPGDYKLIKIFQRVLTIIPIVRSTDTPPTYLSENNIPITKSADFIINLPMYKKFSFEDIDEISTQLRQIGVAKILEGGNRGAYKKMLEIIKNCNPNFKLVGLYTNKDGYYNLVHQELLDLKIEV